MVAFHRETGAKATILLTPVADPSRYGLVRLAADGRVESFLEKPRPEEIDTDLINAGLYVLEPEVLDLDPSRPRRCRSSARSSRSSPRRGPSTGSRSPGYWLDVGTPESYLQAHRDVLERIFQTEVGDALGADFTLVDPTAEVHPGARLVPPVYVGPGAVVEEGARLGSLAVLGAGSRLAAGGVVENAVVGARTRDRRAARRVVGSIVGDDADIGAGCELHNLAVVGPGATVGGGNVLDHGLRIGAGSGSRRRRCSSRERRRSHSLRLVTAEGREAVGLGARLGRGRAPTSASSSSCGPGESLSLQYHEVKDESWLVQEGRATPRARGGRRRARDDRDRARRRLPLPARHGASRDRASRTRS